MNEQVYLIIMAILQIFGVLFIGWLARYKNYIHENEINRWSRFVIDFLFPLFTFNYIANEFESNRFGELWPLPFIGFGLMAFGAMAGYFLKKGVRNKDSSFVKTFHHFCAVNNYGFLPIIIVGSILGEKAIARLLFLNLGSSIGYWTIGVALLGEPDIKKTIKKILTPNLIAIFIALFFALSGLNIYIPTLVFKISKFTGAAAIPCMLILAGATIYPFPALTDKIDVMYLCLVRLTLLPIITIACIYFLPVNSDVKVIASIVALMPTSVSSTVITRRYGGSPIFAAQAAVATTIVSIITVPFGIWLLKGIIF